MSVGGTVKKLSAALVSAVIAGVAVAGSSSAAPAQPDLVVTDVKWAPRTPIVGQGVTFTATVTNRGNAPTPEGVVHGVGFGVRGSTVTWSDTWRSSLPPGGSVTLTANSGPRGSASWPVTAGANSVVAFVDDARRITESDEANNTRTVTVTGASGLTARLNGGTPVVTAAPMNVATGLTNGVSGDTYLACFAPDGALVPGTERYGTPAGAGNTSYGVGTPWGDSGEGSVPASTTPVRVVASGFDLTEIKKYQQYAPHELRCPAGTEPGWDYLHVTKLTTTRYHLDGRVIASVVTPVDVELDMR
ncbi:CARDB domain-containing protein [Kineococcus terrestris]|uniref:CARDB domain-containing protein n=1 Tax=Kineococcus terrestris TaxID=2044856 RepID=UPI0034DB3717